MGVGGGVKCIGRARGVGGGTKWEMVDEHTEKGNGVMRDGGRNVRSQMRWYYVKLSNSMFILLGSKVS